MSECKEKKREVTQKECVATWEGTLRHFGINRTVSDWENTQIIRAALKYGEDMVELALFGARFEKKTEKFDPKDYLSLARILEKDRQGVARIDLYANAGARQRANAQSEAGQRAAASETLSVERTDPKRVREIIANAFRPIPQVKGE